MELTRLGSVRLQLGCSVSPKSIPLRLLVTLYIYLAILLSTSVLLSVTRHVAPVDPFAAYNDIFPGQPMSAASSMGFSCRAGYVDVTCRNGDVPLSPPFSQVYVVVFGSHITRADFSVPGGALTIGDLAILWGIPDIQLIGGLAIPCWPATGVSALAILPDDRQFIYFSPVVRVSFTAPAQEALYQS